MLQKFKDFLFKPKRYDIFLNIWLGLIVLVVLAALVVMIISEILTIGLLSSINTLLICAVTVAILLAILCLIIYGIPLVLQVIVNIALNTFKTIKNKFKGE